VVGAVVGAAGLAGATFGVAGADVLLVFAGTEVLLLFAGAVGATGAMFAAGVDGVGDIAAEVTLVTGVVCPTGAAFGLGTIAAASARWVFQARLVTMLTKAVAETPSAVTREPLAGCGFRFIINHHRHR
jgi:hypothetical protein